MKTTARIIILAALFVVALIAILCESDNLTAFAISKAVGAAAAAALAILYRRWHRSGYLDRLEKFVESD